MDGIAVLYLEIDWYDQQSLVCILSLKKVQGYIEHQFQQHSSQHSSSARDTNKNLAACPGSMAALTFCNSVLTKLAHQKSV